MEHRHDDLTLEELRAYHRVATEADDVLEPCIRDHLALRATLARFLPGFERWIGARAVLLSTQDEHLQAETFTWGAADALAAFEPRHGDGCLLLPTGDTMLWQQLDLAGTNVGRIDLLLRGDRTAEIALLRLVLDAACGELDAVLGAVHTAGHKQRLVVQVDKQLTNPVFELGMDSAVSLLHREIGAPKFGFLYRDAVDQQSFHYRVYDHGVLCNESERNRHAGLEAAIRSRGAELLDPSQRLLRDALEFHGGVESVLISGMTNSEWLGKVVYASAEHGFSTFALDVVELMCEAIGQRLVDFNRERRHLAQFFDAKVISELLRDPAYLETSLAPREETVAVLYADINSFTKISEQVMVESAAIGRFVDGWSAGAVQLLWDHGGVFDKMVGDCIIGIFGPPFFRESPELLAARAVKAARAISRFTTDLEKAAPYDRVPKSGVIPGMGVAIGLNLCSMSVGLFGPNKEYTGFSSGMNATARLQSLAGFRETQAMASVCDALEKSGDAILSELTLGAWTDTPVKNVKHPLRHRRIDFK
jgi:adenylate cyclase